MKTDAQNPDEEISESIDRLNNVLTVVLANIALAKIYVRDDRDKAEILKKLTDAEGMFPEIKRLLRRLASLEE